MSPQRHRSAQQQLLNMTSNSANRHPVSDRGSRAVGSRYRKPVSQSRFRLFSGSGLVGIELGGYVLLDITALVVV